jgi:alpha-tubulin suppressor-like RCC1 family protein
MKRLMIIVNKKNTTRFFCMLVMLMTLTSCNKLFVKAKSLLVELDPTSTTPNSNNPTTSSGAMLSALTEGYCFFKSDSEQYCWGSLFTNQPVNHAPTLKTAYQPLIGKTITNIISTYDGGLKCTIPNDGIPACWGSNYYGQIGNGERGDDGALVPTSPDFTGVLNGKTVKEIVLGNSSTCVIASDDQVYCWGENGFGQLGNGSTTDSNTPVAVSTAGVLNGKTIKVLKSADDTTCVIASDDKLYCWGYGRFGALANGSTANSTIPIAVAGGALGAKTIKQLDMNDNTTCVIASDDKMYCWGYGAYGTLGNGASSNSSATVAVDFTGVLSGKIITQVHMAGLFTCVLADARVYCWGYGGEGALGQGATSNTNVPGAVNTAGVLSGKSITKIAGTGSTMCALTSDNFIACWGFGYDGELGNGTSNANSTLPVLIDSSGAISGKTITDLVSSKKNVCALTSDGLVFCWGEGYFGNKLSQNTNEVSVPTSPDMTEALSGKTILEFGVGLYVSCALASDHQIYCWGGGSGGELGNGTDTFTNYPVSQKTTDSSDELILDAKYLTYVEGTVCAQRGDGELFCGVTGKSLSFVYDFGNEEIVDLKLREDDFKCALTDVGNLYCWGGAGDGVLGNGTNDDLLIPTLIKMSGALLGKTIKSFEIGENFVCAIASDDLAYCWGSDSQGQLGGNTGNDSDEPIAVDRTGVLSGKKINSLTIYSETVCAIADDLKAYCWGEGFDGQLGDGVSPSSDVPVAVSTAGVLNNKTIKKISIMDTMVCAIASDDLMYCWGDNTSGQLGDGTTNFSPVPVAVDMSGVLSGKTIKDFTSNNYTTCAIASDDKVYCWGYGADGSLGDGNSVNSLVPVAVDSTGALSGKKIVEIKSSYASICAMDDGEEVYCWGDGDTGEVGNGLNNFTVVPVKLAF